MSDSTGVSGRLALFVPISVIAAVPVAALAVSPYNVVSTGSVAIGTAVAAAFGWILSPASSPPWRIARAVLAAALSVVMWWLLLLVIWPATITPDGVLPAWTVGVYVFGPLIGLPAASLLLRRNDRSGSASRLAVWWLVAVLAVGAAWPLVGLMSTGNPGQDMAGLIIYWIPVIALCIWAGPALMALGARLIRRRNRSAHVAPEVAS